MSAASTLRRLFGRAEPAAAPADPPGPVSPAQRFFLRPLRPIEAAGRGSTPIWAAKGYDPDNLEGISERFLGKADIYTETYTHSENVLDLLKRAIEVNAIPMGDIHNVLDFGSGPGTNTIFPLHLIKPALHIVATDISLPLLATLSRLLDSHPQRDRVDIVAWDCQTGGACGGAFELVTGASLLHHLMDPRKALEAAAWALRPGGYAFFIDPFDGAGLVRGLYQVLLKANVGHNERLNDETVVLLEVLSLDYAARLAGTEPADFAELEDKWIFSQEQIVAWGRDAGFGSVVIRGNQHHEHMYREYVQMQLRIGGGPRAADLPEWAGALLDAFDASMTPAARRRMMLEGTIVMRK